MGSHVYAARYMRDELLPHGRVSGWCPGNYLGYPMFQFYFPLPFALMSALSLVMPLNVAFKLVSQLGSFLLPLCAYFSLRLAAVPFPGPALGALSTLFFLFMEANSMWGGNIPSTLAGEFTFAIGMALTMLFVGTLRHTVATGRGRIANGLLIATIGLNHGYTLLGAGFCSLVELVAARGWWRRLGTLVVIHGLGVLLIAFWLVPLLAYTPWTTAYSHVWFIKDWKEILPPILWPATGVAVGTTLVVAIACGLRRESFPRALAGYWWVTLIGVLFYLAAPSFHVVDIRFLPFFQLGLCLTAAAGVGYVLGFLPVPEVWPIAAALAVLPWVQGKVTFVPAWIRWNYSGFEKKGPWPTVASMMDHLRGDFRQPRVVFEHSPDHEALGTIRIFENLPLLSGRSTLEGLYMQGSPSAPFVFYTQSEISKDISCPFPDWGCARVDLDRGLEHLRMFNTSQYIVKSERVKGLAAKHPGLERQWEKGGYEVYGVRGNDPRYAIPLAVAPVLVRTSDWKVPSYRWFKTADTKTPVVVFATEVDSTETGTFAGDFAELPRDLPRRDLGPPPELREQMETDRIVIDGCRPGHPILIRVSYHPRWQARTGERVWLASPSFMLVVPRGERVELVFGGAPPVTYGHVLTWLGVSIFVLAFLPVGRRLGSRALAIAGGVPPLPAIRALGQQAAEWPARRQRAVLISALAIAGAGFAIVAYVNRTTDADSLYRKGQQIYDAKRYAEALPYFREARRLAPLSNTAVHSTYYESISLQNMEAWPEAEKAFQFMVDAYPEANAVAESQFHVGTCRQRQGNVQGAIEAWRETQRRFPATDWAKYAAQRLAEVGAGPNP
jgi:hypothetical protein